MDPGIKVNDLMKFESTDSVHRKYNGKSVKVIRIISEPEKGFDEEVLPMVQVELVDSKLVNVRF